MTNSLLGLFRSERGRQLAPAVVALKVRADDITGNRNWPQKVVGDLRRRIGLLRLMFVKSSYLVLPDSPRLVLAKRGHKYSEVRDLLIRNGLDAKKIVFASSADRDNLAYSLLTGRYRIVRNLVDWIYFNFRMLGRSSDFLAAICLYCVCYRELKNQYRHLWLCIGDLSTWQLALAAAARQAGHRVVSWQLDYLDF